MSNEETIIINTYQFSEFSKTMSCAYLNTAIESVRNTNFSANEIKGIAVDIMKKVADKKDTELMNCVADTVELWKNDKTKGWKMTLAKFARVNNDIFSIYAGRSENGNEFVIVVDDSASDDILDYSEFCFELAEKYNNIANFMILDREEYSDMEDFFSGFKKIYQRG